MMTKSLHDMSWSELLNLVKANRKEFAATRDLFLKYIRHVGHHEGVDFIEDRYRDNHEDVDFTDEEWSKLRILSDIVWRKAEKDGTAS